MNRIVINGTEITTSGNNVVINGSGVFVDGKEIHGGNMVNTPVEIYGDVGSLRCGGSCTVGGNISGNVNCGGSCQCEGSVEGDINAGGSVSCKR